MSATPPLSGDSAPIAAPRAAVIQLAVGQTLCWAGLYYLFPALLSHWESDLAWSKAGLSIAFTIALVVSALAAPLSGRLIDRGFGPLVLAGSAFGGGLLVASLAFAGSQWQFMAIWCLIGLAMAGALYEPCFSFLIRHYGGEAKKPITLVTLVAGFAGTVSFPSSFALAEAAGWRTAVLVAGAVVSLVAAPLLLVAARKIERGRPVLRLPLDRHADHRLWRVMRSPVFWFLAFAFAAVALDHGVLITHLLPLLKERGVADEAAVLAASMIGPMQVTGRLAMIVLERTVSMVAIAGAALLVMFAAALALAATSAVPALIVVFVVLQGAGYGVTSITRPVVTASLLGHEDFGVVSGAMAVAFMGATAVAPTLAAGLWQVGGYELVIGFCAAVAVAGFLAHVAALLVARRGASGGL